MKRVLSVLLGLSLLFAACGDGKEIVVVKPGLRLSPPVPIVFSSDGGTKKITVITNQSSWSVSSDQSWCDAQVEGNTVVITARKTVSRTDLPTATVTVTAGEGEETLTATVTVDQTHVPPFVIGEEESANCYIIKDKGVYRLYAGYRGKSETPTVEDFKGCTADWVWMTTGGLIKVSPEVSADGYITFSTPEDKLVQGSAVIALLKDGKIVWSWHIWVTDCVKILDGNNFMNVNLGATSDVVGSAGSLGFYYQWGRKEPFIGAAGVGTRDVTSFNEQTPFSQGTENGVSYTAASVVNPTVAADWNVDGSGAKYTEQNLVEKPTTFIGQWGSTPYYSVRSWSKATDPCPPGWRVPSYNDMAANLGVPPVDFDVYRGIVQGGNNYWPATGYRHTYMPYSYNGRLLGVGEGAIYWTGSQRKDTGFAAGIYFDSREINVNDFMITYGLSTRCILDKIY